MPVSRWKKFKNALLRCVILAGFPLLAWAAYSFTTDAYKFWKHGIAKPAEIVALERTSSFRGGTHYYYQLEMDGEPVVAQLRVCLRIGKTVSVLTLPDEPGNVVLGTEQSTWFELYSRSVGGELMGVVTLATFVFMLVCGPMTVVQLIREPHAILDQED